MRELKRNRKFETVDDSLYDMSGDEYTEDEDYMKYIHPKVVQWFKDFTKSYKLWNGVEKKNIAIIEDIVDSEVVPDDVVDDCNDWVESDYFYSLGYLDYDIIDLSKKFLSTYTYPTKENKTMRELKRSRMNEASSSKNEIEKLLNEFIGDLNTIKHYTEEFEKYYKDAKGTRREKEVLDRYLSIIGNPPENFKEILTRIIDYRNSL